jgi:basic membrane protein A
VSPSPSPGLVKSIVLVGEVGQSAAGTPSALAWAGVQDAAGGIGATADLVTPTSMAELTAAVTQAATDGKTVVVTVGPGAAAAVLKAAQEHAGTQFFELDQAVPDKAPANLHGLVFDEAEAGYLAGVVASSLTSSHVVGLVGYTKTDIRTANYAAGFRNGAAYIHPGDVVSVAYSGRADDPQKGRAAAAGLVKGKADVIAAVPDITGIGALRDACFRKALVIGLGADAAALVPDVKPCVAVSILKRYDTAVRDAILRFDSGTAVPATILADVASGGISVGEFGASAGSPGLADSLAGVLAAMKNGPPRPTPTPAATPAP